MKKILLTLAAVVLSFGMLSAQDMSQATETAKMANESLVAGNKALALSGFQEALAQAVACGEEGAELVATCKGVIPGIMLSIAKDLIKEDKFDEALTQLDAVVAKAKEYGADETAEVHGPPLADAVRIDHSRKHRFPPSPQHCTPPAAPDAPPP